MEIPGHDSLSDLGKGGEDFETLQFFQTSERVKSARDRERRFVRKLTEIEKCSNFEGDRFLDVLVVVLDVEDVLSVEGGEVAVGIFDVQGLQALADSRFGNDIENSGGDARAIVECERSDSIATYSEAFCDEFVEEVGVEEGFRKITEDKIKLMTRLLFIIFNIIIILLRVVTTNSIRVNGCE